MSLPVVKTTIRSEEDTVTARHLAQHVAELSGMSAQDRTRLATAVSEIARNALKYADGGTVVCNVVEIERKQYVQFVISDDGPGIPHLERVLRGTYRSRTGMGQGIVGSKKLMDHFSIESSPGKGTTVKMAKEIPYNTASITSEKAAEWAEILACDESKSSVEQAQQHEIVRTVAVLRQKEQDLARQLAEVEKLNRELRAQQDTLQEQASFDALTGLPNRRSIMNTLEQELSRTMRTGQPIGVVMCDLDHFKNLNDTWGHLAGDAVLRETARRMQSVARPYDTVGRYGGEEFLLVMPRCDEEGSVSLAERVRTAVGETEMSLDEGTFTVTLSLGITTSGLVQDAAALIDIADMALYRAKHGGRNRVELATLEEVREIMANRASNLPSSRLPGIPTGSDES